MADIPLAVKDFIAGCIHSVSELEILLLLRDSAPEALAPEDIGKALLMHRPAVLPRLETLRASNLIELDEGDNAGRYRYAPGSPELAARADDLAKWYASHPVAITTLIFSKPLDNIIRGFADSFRIRKKEDS
jgi:hypothetical protein